MKSKLYFPFFLFIAICGILNYFVKQENTVQLIGCYMALFGLFFYIIHLVKDDDDVQPVIIFGVLCRLALIGAAPNLSHDVERYLWDGKMQGIGLNPYSLTPKELMDRNLNTFSNAGNVYHLLASKKEFTMYPPVMQLIFLAAIKFSILHDRLAVMLMKFFIVCAEMVTISQLLVLLKRFNMPAKNILLYALNPLIIIELTGNIHFEAVMICLLLVSFNYYLNNKRFWSAVFFVLAVGTKILPLALLPIILFRQTIKSNIKTVLTLGVLLWVLFYPYFQYTDLRLNFLAALKMYYHTFDFNSSFYHWLGFVFQQLKLANYEQLVSVSLSAITFIIFIIYAWLKRKVDELQMIKAALLFFTLYFITASTVYPWYVSTVFVLAMFTRFRFAYLWIVMLPLTYLCYHFIPAQENYLINSISYLLLFGLIILEFWKREWIEKWLRFITTA